MINFNRIYSKVPGGSLLIPMLAGAIINSLFPNFMTTLGGTSLATFKAGALTIIGIVLFALGANTNIRTLGALLRRNGTLAIAKLIIGVGFGFLFVKLFGMNGVAGISTVAFVVCMCSTNPGVYMGLIADYGEPIDMGNVPIMTTLSLPVFPMLVLATGGATLNIMDIITVLVPFLLGILFGNLDPELAQSLKPLSIVLLPFLGFNFGSSINLMAALQAGISGILLGILYMILNVPIMLFADRLFNKRPGYAATAMCSVAGFSVAVPAILGSAFASYADAAVPQIVMCLVISCIVIPVITKAVVKKYGSPKTTAAADIHNPVETL